jgi:hypothetical protein
MAEEGAAKSSAKMLTNFGGPQAAVLDSIVLHSLLQHSNYLSSIIYRKAMQ